MTVPDNEELLKLLKVLGWQFARPEKHRPRPDKLGLHYIRLNLNVASGDQDMTTTLLPLGGKQNETFENVFNLLSQEPRVKNRTRIERNKIRRELRNYCGEIFQNRQSINNDQDIDSRARTFLDRVLLPEQEWLVVSPIDGLDLERGTKRRELLYRITR